MKDRIRQLMESQHMTQQTFSDFIGISSASLSSIFNGRTKPTLNTVEAIRNKFPSLSLEWIMYGIGPMFLDDVHGNEAATSTPLPVSEEQSLDFGMIAQVSKPSGMASQNTVGVDKTPKVQSYMDMKIPNKIQRHITEIRIFYDDQTWETFVPKK